MARWEALCVGLGTNARGAMGLIIAILGFSLGILTLDMYSVIIMMAVVTTAMTPPLLRWALRHARPSAREQARLAEEEHHAASFVGGLRRVLLATGGGPHTLLAAYLLRALAMERRLEVTVLRVAASGSAAVPPPELLRALDAGGVELVTRSVAARDPVPAVLREAALGYDMLVLGAGPGPSREQTVFGAIPDAIAGSSPQPALVVRAAPGGASRLRRILVPTSGADHAVHAGELAVALARSSGAAVTALCVVEQPDEILFWLARQHDQPRELARQVLSQVAALGEAFGVPVDVSVEAAAHAAPAIVEAARRVEADLVLLGGSARPTHRLFMGSTISYVLNHAPCAVAVIRP